MSYGYIPRDKPKTSGLVVMPVIKNGHATSKQEKMQHKAAQRYKNFYNAPAIIKDFVKNITGSR